MHECEQKKFSTIQTLITRHMQYHGSLSKRPSVESVSPIVIFISLAVSAHATLLSGVTSSGTTFGLNKRSADDASLGCIDSERNLSGKSHCSSN